MATAKKVTTIADLQQEEADLMKQEEVLAKASDTSSGFWSQRAPSGADLRLDVQKRTLAARKKALESNILAKKVYGDTTAAEAGTAVEPQGVISKVLDIAMRPLYAEVGVAKHILGKGEATLGESIMANERNKDLYGNLLKQMGVTPKVASVLGFGMDVIGDPVNLLSGGMIGLSRTGLGKVAVGAKTAGLAGAALGAKTSALKTAAKVASFIPFNKVDLLAAKKVKEMAAFGIKEDSPEFVQGIQKAFFKTLPKTEEIAPGIANKIVGGIRTGIYKLSKAAETASNKYDLLTGWDPKKSLAARADRESIAEKFKSMLVQHPLGATLVDQFEYNSNQWMQNAKLWNLLTKAFDKQGRLIQDVYDPATKTWIKPTTEQIQEYFNKTAEVGSNKSMPRFTGYTAANKGEIVDDVFKSLDEGIEAMGSGDKFRLHDAQMAREALWKEIEDTNKWNDINDVFYRMLGKEERGWVDRGRNWVAKNIVLGKNSEKKIQLGTKILDFYDIALGLFKSSKISSLSPSSMIYAILGNGTMQHMSGINMLRPEVYARLKDATILLSGGKMGLGMLDTAKDYERVLNLLSDPIFKNFWEDHGDLAKQILGIDAHELSLMETGIRAEFAKFQNLTPDELAIQKKIYGTQRKGVIEKGSSLNQFIAKGRGLTRVEEMPTGIVAGELGTNRAFLKFKETISEKAAEGNIFAKALDFGFQRSRDFEKADQIWKLQNFLLLTQDGVTERELLKLTNSFITTTAKIGEGDIIEKVFKRGENYYKLSPEKALEIANETFMNYAAMPAFVKAIRSMPVLGSPFFSFQYAMLAKTGKTMLNNPAAFNQINFLIKELEADKSPVERAALKTKYYSYLDKPGMVNLGENVPLFVNNPLYLNLSQMIPYYSLNILNPATRSFNDTIRGKFASVLDQSQLMKDPVGQILMDYIVLPSLLYDETPKNMFGGQLYPEGTSLLGKVGLAARTGVEAFVPSSAGWLAPLVPDSMKNLIPSYPGRKISYAVEGKTTMGIQTNEDPASKGLRAYLGTLGINLYPVELQNVINEINKQSK